MIDTISIIKCITATRRGIKDTYDLSKKERERSINR